MISTHEYSARIPGEYSPWAEKRRNLAYLSPSKFGVGTGTPAAGITPSRDAQGLLNVTAAPTNGNYLSIAAMIGTPSPAPKVGDLVTVSFEIKSPDSTLAPLFYTEADGYKALTGKLGPEFTTFSRTWAWGGYNPHLGFNGRPGTYVFRNLTLEVAPAPRGFFDGNTNPSGELERTRWLGAPDASVSVLEVREAAVLSVKGGSVSLDARRRPHVQGDLTIALPPLWVLAKLDPRMSPVPRIVVDVTARFPWGVQARTFDLTLRDRAVNVREGTVSLVLASDESLLADTSPLADDPAPLNYQGSLRALVGYVLGTVLPGAVLEAGSDVPVPALADSSNLIRNPRAGTGITDWRAAWSSGGLTQLRQATGGPSWAPTYVAHLSAASVVTNNAEIFIDEGAVSITTGKQYILSVGMSGAAGRQLILDAVCFDSTGNITGFIPAITATMLAGGAWQRAATAPFEAYPNTARIRVRVRAAQLAGSEYVNVTGWRLTEATGDPTADGLYYDGDTADTAQYDYSWQQNAHASISNRKVKVDAATPAALICKAGQDWMSFLAPLVQAAGRRLICDEQRVWTLRTDDYDPGGALEVRHAVNLVDGSDKISRDDDDWYDAAVAVYRWTDASGTPRERTDAYALTPSYTRLRRFDFTTPYPGPGFAQYVVHRVQGRGREVTVRSVSDWSVRAEQGITAVLEGAPTQTGSVDVVTFSFDTDEMTITSRTIDTLPGAWLLLPAGQKWTDSPVGGSWIGEAV